MKYVDRQMMKEGFTKTEENEWGVTYENTDMNSTIRMWRQKDGFIGLTAFRNGNDLNFSYTMSEKVLRLMFLKEIYMSLKYKWGKNGKN